jgi:methylenetetrahydrofolate dehydrogenase (NADP+)/methenyltetrahydrofolate cyclohydrolase
MTKMRDKIMTAAKLIDGKAIAARTAGRASPKRLPPTQVKAKHHLTPGLAVILVGDDPASQPFM